MKKPTDGVALLEFVDAAMKRGDWQGAAMAEVAYMATDLGVAWPVSGNRGDWGEFDYLIVYALASLHESTKPDATLETAFEAGRCVQRVLEKWTEVMISRKGKPRTDHFYIIADNLVAGGTQPTVAYRKAQIHMQKYRPDLPIPTRAAFKRHRAIKRGNNG